MKHRICKKTLDAIPREVADQIRSLGKQYSLKSFTIETKPYGHEIYHAEGSKYHYVYKGDSTHVEMVAEHNIGASNVRHEIGTRVKPPTGTTVIEIWYYSGFGMHVTNITDPALPVSS